MSEHRLYQWTTKYPDGSEGAISGYVPTVGHVPLYTRDRATADKMMVIAEQHARTTGQRCWLRTWLTYEDNEFIVPVDGRVT
jgi:hypothetical protein